MKRIIAILMFYALLFVSPVLGHEISGGSFGVAKHNRDHEMSGHFKLLMPIQQWEYKVCSELGCESIVELGRKGWELVSVIKWDCDSRHPSVHFYFKRLKSGESK